MAFMALWLFWVVWDRQRIHRPRRGAGSTTDAWVIVQVKLLLPSASVSSVSSVLSVASGSSRHKVACAGPTVIYPRARG